MLETNGEANISPRSLDLPKLWTQMALLDEEGREQAAKGVHDARVANDPPRTDLAAIRHPHTDRAVLFYQNLLSPTFELIRSPPPGLCS